MTLDFLAADIAVVWAASAIVMTAAFLWQNRTRNAGMVDAMWAGLLACAALYYSATGEGSLLPRLLVGVLGSIWGFRLALHVMSRVLHESEDGRYAYLRQHWKDDQLKFFLFFQAQALLVVLFSIPFWIAAQNDVAALTLPIVLGVVIWCVALAGEALADFQLQRFRRSSRNAGRTCREGLWRYSRHPNYFFEWLHWFAYVGIAAGSPIWAWSLIGPVLMLVTLNWITGIPFCEAQSLRSRGEDYQRYQQETSRFFPWWPRLRG